ncbi:MAG: NUDIX hydrolase [Candidatus Vogelbacteria bacterium]|nr:NUDIX hydrolase [Candidatus Vogelbacteria bacterium]
MNRTTKELRVVVVHREKKRRGKDGSTLEWCLPGGKKWRAYGLLKETKREVGGEIGQRVKAIYVIGSRRHPQFPRRIIHYTLCTLVTTAPLEEIRFWPGKNIREVRLVTPEDFCRLVKTDIFPPLAGILGLTPERISAIKAEIRAQSGK